MVDPFRQLLYSTRAKDVTAIRSYRNAGLSLADAVNAVIRDREAEADRRRTGESDSESGEAA